MIAFLHDEAGQGMIESGLLIAVVSIVAIGTLAVLGKKVVQMFSEIDDAFSESVDLSFNK